MKTVVEHFTFAAQQGQLEFVKVLLKFGALIDSKYVYSRTALHIASHRGYLEFVEVLLKIDAVIDSKNEDGRTALHIASQ
jgi:ankyrin repeat protein